MSICLFTKIKVPIVFRAAIAPEIQSGEEIKLLERYGTPEKLEKVRNPHKK
jgi:hypothetical protein